jgi:secondary thiamine-phosphate synthase enzyme
MLEKLTINTGPGDNLVDFTDDVRAAVAASGVEAGVCVLVVPHTTAGLTINSGIDGATMADIVAELKHLVPTRADFVHQHDTPTDAAGHIKATLVGQSQSLIIDGGRLLLAESQNILFCEFDGPRERRVLVKILAG